MVKSVSGELLRGLYDGVCTVYASEPEKGDIGWTTESEKTVVYEDIPCHLAYAVTPTVGEDLLGMVKAEFVLFLGAEYEILPGSEVLVCQCGKEFRLRLCGVARVYAMHREIRAALVDEVA